MFRGPQFVVMSSIVEWVGRVKMTVVGVVSVVVVFSHGYVMIPIRMKYLCISGLRGTVLVTHSSLYYHLGALAKKNPRSAGVVPHSCARRGYIMCRLHALLWVLFTHAHTHTTHTHNTHWNLCSLSVGSFGHMFWRCINQ